MSFHKNNRTAVSLLKLGVGSIPVYQGPIELQLRLSLAPHFS
jgi:hypothetical protein